ARGRQQGGPPRRAPDRRQGDRHPVFRLSAGLHAPGPAAHRRDPARGPRRAASGPSDRDLRPRLRGVLTKGPAMPAALRQITPADLIPDADYARERRERRLALLPVKRLRRVELGPFCTVLFENYDTMLFQVQEMLLTEKG